MRLIGLSILALIAVAASVYAYVFVYQPDFLPYETYLRTADIVERADEAIESIAPSCTRNSASLVDVPVPEPIPDTALEARSVIVPTALPAAYAGAPVVDDIFGGQRHQLSHIESIPATSEGEIRLSVIVGEDGRVLSVLPVSGPEEFYAHAVAIARHWKFEPYWRDGKPTIVRINNVPVLIGRHERRPDARVAFPPIKDKSSLRVRLMQVPGQYSASYDVTIRGDGTVTYNGKWLVGVLGRHCAVIRPEAVDLLLAQFRRADFFRLHDQYAGSMNHAHTTVLSIDFDGHTKTVTDYLGSTDGMSDIVAQLERFVLDAAGADRWIKGNEFTARSLTAERWDMAADNDANRGLLDGIATYGTADAVRGVLGLGAPIQTAWREQERKPPWWPTLVAAAQRDDPVITRALLRTDARWDQAALDSALYFRVRVADLELINELITRGAGPSLNYKRQTLLMQAAESGVPAVVTRVLALPSDVHARDEEQRTALHSAAVSNHFGPAATGEPASAYADRGAVVALLIRAGARVDARDKFGVTPLIANWLGFEDVATALIAAGADVNARDNEGETALSNARTPEMVAILLAAGADPLIGGGLAVREAADNDRFDVARALLRARVAWPKSTLGKTLYYAAAKAQADLVDELAAHGADVHARAELQRTPLMGAALSGVPDIILRVLALRPDVNAVDASGYTTLHLANGPRGEHPPVDRPRSVKLLLDAGADMNLRDQFGRTLMHDCPDAEVITLLVERGANVDDRDTFGETALMRCVSLAFPRDPRFLDAIQRLLELGADPLLRNNEGKSVLDLARHGDGKPDVAAALERWMAARGARP